MVQLLLQFRLDVVTDLVEDRQSGFDLLEGQLPSRAFFDPEAVIHGAVHPGDHGTKVVLPWGTPEVGDPDACGCLTERLADPVRDGLAGLAELLAKHLTPLLRLHREFLELFWGAGPFATRE